MLEDIKGINFGGISSRFWMLRKHLNSMDASYYKIENIPLYAWQCLTLQLKHRDVDIVIKDDNDMNDILTVLISVMNTVDGKKNSQTKIEEHILKIKEK